MDNKIVIHSVYDDRNRKIGFYAVLPSGEEKHWCFLNPAKAFIQEAYPESEIVVLE